MNDWKKTWSKIFHPFWKILISLIPILLKWFSIFQIVRDDFLPERYHNPLRLINLIGKFMNILNSIPWVWYIVVALIIFIILKANDKVKKEEMLQRENELKDAELKKLNDEKLRFVQRKDDLNKQLVEIKKKPMTLVLLSEISQTEKEISEINIKLGVEETVSAQGYVDASNDTLQEHFNLQGSLAQRQFEKDKELLGNPPDPVKIKYLFSVEILPIVNRSKLEGVSLYDLKYFEFCYDSGIFLSYLSPGDNKLVHDRFYEKYPSLKPEGYETIQWKDKGRPDRLTEDMLRK